MLPAAALASRCRASGSYSACSACRMWARCSLICRSLMFFRWNCRQSREDGRGQFLRVGGGEDEFDVRRRFFQCFQQRIEAAGGKHMHFVNEIDFVLSFDRRVGDVVEQFARFFNAGARGGIYFDEVGKAPWSISLQWSHSPQGLELT